MKPHAGGRLSKTTELLEAAGRALYGERWIMRLGRDLNISDDTISRWLRGKTHLPMNHGALKDTENFLRAKAVELLNVANQLRQARETFPED